MTAGQQVLAGGAPSPVKITNQTVYNGAGAPGSATATYTVATDRFIKDQAATNLEQWLNSNYAASGFEVRATLQSGTAPSAGTLGTWQALTANRSWSQTKAGTVGVRTCNLLIEIGYLGAGSALSSAVATITAEVS